jgi:hypothetical protein
VVDRVVDVANAVARTAGVTQVVIVRTGVGDSVLDMFRERNVWPVIMPRFCMCPSYRWLVGGASPKSRISEHYSPNFRQWTFSEVRMQDRAYPRYSAADFLCSVPGIRSSTYIRF